MNSGNGKGKRGSDHGTYGKTATSRRPPRIALFPFATNAVGRVPAAIENMIAVYLLNGLSRVAGLEVMDLTPSPHGREVLSLAGTLSPDDVREAAARAGVDAAVWGDLTFKPGNRPVIEAVEVNLLFARTDAEDAPRRFSSLFRGVRGDVRVAHLSVDIPALEDLAEELVLAVSEMLGMDRSDLRPERIGEGMTHNYRALLYFVYALRMVGEGQWKIGFYRKAIAADPHFALAYINLAQLLLGEGRNGEAMRILLQAQSRLKGSEAEPDILNLLGVTTLHMGMWEEAVKVWERALSLCPGHRESLCNLAAAYATRDRNEEAEKLYRRALKPGNEYPLACISLGRLLAREGRYEEARGLIDLYIRLQPGDPWAYYILGACLASLGSDEEARFALAKAAQLDPDGEAGFMARRELGQLKKG